MSVEKTQKKKKTKKKQKTNKKKQISIDNSCLNQKQPLYNENKNNF